eukprot:gene29473-38577_t
MEELLLSPLSSGTGDNVSGRGGISCHSFNRDRSMVALCPNNNEIHIYETKTWTRLHSLAEHDLLVSAIDWSEVTDRIVSCSHDRNSFVWTYDSASNVWRPALVILRIDRAATDVKWSLDGLRFAVTSGSKCVPMIKKKFKSTVLCCAFHPKNSQLVATGCADFKCRIFSTFASDVDGTVVNPGPFAVANGGPGPLEFGEAYCELSSLGHDSSLQLATFANGSEPVVRTVRLHGLPLRSLLFLSEVAIIGGGDDLIPAIYTRSYQSGEWALLTTLDKLSPSSSSSPPPPPPPVRAASASTIETGSTTVSARELFKNKTVRGQDVITDTLKSSHERPIDCIKSFVPSPGPITRVSTSSLDGKLILWNLPQLEINMALLGV